MSNTPKHKQSLFLAAFVFMQIVIGIELVRSSVRLIPVFQRNGIPIECDLEDVVGDGMYGKVVSTKDAVVSKSHGLCNIRGDRRRELLVALSPIGAVAAPNQAPGTFAVLVDTENPPIPLQQGAQRFVGVCTRVRDTESQILHAISGQWPTVNHDTAIVIVPANRFEGPVTAMSVVAAAVVHCGLGLLAIVVLLLRLAGSRFPWLESIHGAIYRYLIPRRLFRLLRTIAFASVVPVVLRLLADSLARRFDLMPIELKDVLTILAIASFTISANLFFLTAEPRPEKAELLHPVMNYRFIESGLPAEVRRVFDVASCVFSEHDYDEELTVKVSLTLSADEFYCRSFLRNDSRAFGEVSLKGHAIYSVDATGRLICTSSRGLSRFADEVRAFQKLRIVGRPQPSLHEALKTHAKFTQRQKTIEFAVIENVRGFHEYVTLVVTHAFFGRQFLERLPPLPSPSELFRRDASGRLKFVWSDPLRYLGNQEHSEESATTESSVAALSYS